VNAIASERNVPPENLITPELVRRVVWEPPADPTADSISDALRAMGAREWQVGLVGGPIAEALPTPPPSEAAVPEPEAAQPDADTA
jgi:ribonuclease D